MLGVEGWAISAFSGVSIQKIYPILLGKMNPLPFDPVNRFQKKRRVKGDFFNHTIHRGDKLGLRC